jgi:hypothetical protein
MNATQETPPAAAMDLRDALAAGLLALPVAEAAERGNLWATPGTTVALAMSAYEMAESMLKARGVPDLRREAESSLLLVCRELRKELESGALETPDGRPDQALLRLAKLAIEKAEKAGIR